MTTKYPRGRPPKSKTVMNTIPSSNPILERQDAYEKEKDEPVTPAPTPSTSPDPKEGNIKPKKERTEAQLQATKRLIETNKKRKITIIESAPKQKEEVKEEISLQDKLKVMEEKLAMMEQKTVKKERKAKPKPEPEQKKEKPIKERKPLSDSESESDDDEYVERYKQKAERRFQAVRDIEQRLQQAKQKPKGKYDHLSLF